MSNQAIASLLNRAAAALETPNDLTEEDKRYLIEDLTAEARWIDPDDRGAPVPPRILKTKLLLETNPSFALSVELNKTYRTREGQLSRITSVLEENTQMYTLGYRFVGGLCGQYYTKDGKTHIDDPDPNPGDLIEEYVS